MRCKHCKAVIRPCEFNPVCNIGMSGDGYYDTVRFSHWCDGMYHTEKEQSQVHEPE
jgi:hypothetical protein